MEVQGVGWYFSYICIYFSIMFGIGFYYYKKVKSADDYLIGNWSMGFWPILGTLISTFCGASVFIGSVSLAFVFGTSAYIRFVFVGLIVSLILVVFFAKCLRRQRLYT